MFTFEPFFFPKIICFNTVMHIHTVTLESHWVEKGKKKEKKKTDRSSIPVAVRQGWREWPLRDKLLVGRRQAGWGWGVLAWAAALGDSHLWLFLQFDVDHWEDLVKQHQRWIGNFHFSIFCSVIWRPSHHWTFCLFCRVNYEYLLPAYLFITGL